MFQNAALMDARWAAVPSERLDFVVDAPFRPELQELVLLRRRINLAMKDAGALRHLHGESSSCALPRALSGWWPAKAASQFRLRTYGATSRSPCR